MPSELVRDDSTFTVPSHVLSRKANGETVLLNLDTEEYYGLDGIGTRFWDLVETGTTFGGTVATLLQEYDVGRTALIADLFLLLTDLEANGLVRIDAS